MTTNLHAHVSTAAADCDGPMYRDYITTMNDAERNGEFSDLAFKERVLGGHVSFSPLDCVTVVVTEDGFRTQEVTDEGYRSADVLWCEDADCDPHEASQRDVFAEMMGY